MPVRAMTAIALALLAVAPAVMAADARPKPSSAGAASGPNNAARNAAAATPAQQPVHWDAVDPRALERAAARRTNRMPTLPAEHR